MPPKIQKTKEQKAKAAMASRGRKKKWNKGKQRDQLSNAVFFEKPVYERFMKEVPNFKIITPSILSEKFKINVTLARAGIKQLAEEGQITPVVKNSHNLIYTKAAASE